MNAYGGSLTKYKKVGGASWSHDLTAAVLDTIDALVVVFDTQGKIVWFNRACEEITGCATEEARGKQIWDFLLLPREAEWVKVIFDNPHAEQFPTKFEGYWIGENGRRLITWSNTALLDQQGAVKYIVGTGIDITERRRSEEALKETNRKVERLHEVAHRLEACEVEEEVYRLTIEAAEKILGFPLCTLDIVEGGKLVVKATSSRLPPEASRTGDLNEGIAGQTHRTGRIYILSDLEAVPEARPTREDFKSGISAPVGDFGVFQAVSTEPDAFTEDDVRLLALLLGHTAEVIRRIRLEEKLKAQATHDPLTGVYNRYYLNQVLEQEVKRSRRYGHPIAFLIIDVNRFKEINDHFGHQAGDKVLKAVASLLLEAVRETDIVVRYGGDEFLIVLLETDSGVEVVKNRIVERMAQWDETHKLIDFPITLSIGVARWHPNSAKSIEEILAEADRRMYDEKRRRAQG